MAHASIHKFGLYTTSPRKSPLPPLPVVHSLNALLNLLSTHQIQFDKETKSIFAKELAAIIAEPWKVETIMEEIFNALRELPPELD